MTGTNEVHHVISMGEALIKLGFLTLACYCLARAVQEAFGVWRQ